ncbi:MAG: SPOR domain-containing protein [Porticoccus sp.]|jgi:cell division protein FtsN|uniref:SPOR domain-containing protein n=1 Tax=Porticoccus sp. TaxID=2024853 RepID=UPI003296E805|tara:strand:- start:816682 stop:817260 length:579 start_codon:yes stop_codon:yes gene_type:complete
MTRDYARKTGRRSSSNVRRKTPSRQSLPGWLWLLAGILVGIVATFLLQGPESGPVPSDQPTVKPVEEESSAKPRFDFYTLLRETEVIVPDSSVPQVEEEPPNQSASAPATPTAKEVFLLQVGSFKSNRDADSLRARLLLLNLSASIEMVTPRPGETWHRVLVGPFTNRAELASARDSLSGNGIDSLLLKRKQ